MNLKLIALAFYVLTPLTSQAQDSSPTPFAVPQISVAATHEVKVTPDRATIHISVHTRAVTASAAAAENATKVQAVLSALRGLGLTNDQLSTINFNVQPDYVHREGREPTITGYNVTNTILADVRQINQVGRVIDAALSRGANMMTSLQFYASNPEVARRTGIAAAIAKARAEAEAAASAAGGSLGQLLEITIGQQFQPPMPMMRLQAAVASVGMDTPIQPGQESVVVTVNTRWRFNSAR